MRKTEFDVINDLLLAYQQQRPLKDIVQINASKRIEYVLPNNIRNNSEAQIAILDSLMAIGFWKRVANNPFIGELNDIPKLKKELEKFANKYIQDIKYKGFTITKYYTRHGSYSGVWTWLEKTVIDGEPIYGNVGIDSCKRAIDKYLDNKTFLRAPESNIHVFKTDMDYSGGIIFVHKTMLKEYLINDCYSYIGSLEQFDEYIRNNIKKDEILDEFYFCE